ncbi:MAG TPA: hypothetical protein VET85_03830 [Stellaceae bacterium]|nr:hypothetical protein [Stellaceae bacterium]
MATAPWQPDAGAQARLAGLIETYRHAARRTLEPVVQDYYPAMPRERKDEYRKMLELSTKMMVVGHACAEILGQPFDDRLQRISGLFGGCCFLADSFIDDFGEAATEEYLDRFGRLLREGWFEIRTDRERLFYIVIARLFAERDILDPVLRQAITRLYEAQAQDVALRRQASADSPLGPRERLMLLKRCARNRSGHAIIVLASLLAPRLTLAELAPVFAAGALIMYIDDHGDCWSDLAERRLTFMNQVRRPERALRRLFRTYIERVFSGLPQGQGRDLMIAFLIRYYVTRLAKHRQERRRGGFAWAVYE